jgi:hypothetical protein
MERPTLFIDDAGVQLGFVGVSSTDGNTVAWAASDSKGIWSSASAIDDSGRVLAHISPLFTTEGHLVWLRLSENETVELCAWTEGEEAACEDTAMAYARDLSLSDGSAGLVLSAGFGDWELQTMGIPESITE